MHLIEDDFKSVLTLTNIFIEFRVSFKYISDHMIPISYGPYDSMFIPISSYIRFSLDIYMKIIILLSYNKSGSTDYQFNI